MCTLPINGSSPFVSYIVLHNVPKRPKHTAGSTSTLAHGAAKY